MTCTDVDLCLILGFMQQVKILMLKRMATEIRKRAHSIHIKYVTVWGVNQQSLWQTYLPFKVNRQRPTYLPFKVNRQRPTYLPFKVNRQRPTSVMRRMS